VNMKKLENVDVIASTVNDLARQPELLENLDTFMVIVEEAGELAEPQLIASIPPKAQQLVLIGDHLQLKPKTADFHVGSKLGLGTSTFQRLVEGGSELHSFKVQRRMHPKISRLARPLYTGGLEDHPNVTEYKPVPGLARHLLFLDHDFAEEECEGHSKQNKFEAEFAVSLALHLVQNGNLGRSIAILTPYVGQLLFIRKLKQSLTHNAKVSSMKSLLRSR